MAHRISPPGDSKPGLLSTQKRWLMVFLDTFSQLKPMKLHHQNISLCLSSWTEQESLVKIAHHQDHLPRMLHNPNGCAVVWKKKPIISQYLKVEKQGELKKVTVLRQKLYVGSYVNLMEVILLITNGSLYVECLFKNHRASV